jgi:thiol-disulfide isomerase/thioredoxin
LVLVAAVAIVAWKSLSKPKALPPSASLSAQIEWVKQNKRPAMILYHSTNCEPCRKMDALMQMVRRDYEPAVQFIDVNTSDTANEALVLQAQIHSIPTSQFLKSSGESKTIVGLMPQAALRAELVALSAGE